MEQAQSFYAAKNYDSSLIILKEYVNIVQSKEDWVEVFTAQSLMSQNYSRLRDYSGRLQFAEAALNTAQRHLISSDSIYAKALKAKGDALIRTQAYDSSIHYLNRAAEVYLKSDNWSLVASCKVGIGSNLYRQRKFNEADSILTNTRELIEHKIDPLPSIYGSLLNLLSAIYTTTGDYEKGLENATKSVRFRENLSSQGARLINSYNNLGMAHYNRADYDKAREVLERAVLTAEEDIDANNGALITLYNNLMLTHLRRKDYEMALEYAIKRLRLTKEAKVNVKTSEQVIFLNNLALIYLETDRPAEAKLALDKAFELKHDDYQTLANLGYYHYTKRDHPEAAEYLQQAIDISDQPDNPRLAKLYRYLANIASYSADTPLADSLFTVSLQLLVPAFEPKQREIPVLDQISSKRELLKVLTDKARHLHRHEQDFHKVNQTLQSAVALVDSMYLEHKAEGSRLFLKSEALPVYEMAIGTLLLQNDLELDPSALSYLFRLFEKGKSSLLSDLAQVKNANLMAGVPKDLIDQEERLRIDIAFYENELYEAHRAKKEQKATLYDRYRLEKVNELDRLIENFKENYPRYYQARHKPQRLALEAIQERMVGTNEVLIEYFVGPTAIYIMGISPDRVILHEIKNVVRLERMTSQFVRAVNNPVLIQEDQFAAYDLQTTIGLTLYQELLSPILNELKSDKKGIHIVADGFLNALPFEALLTREHQGSMNFTELPYLIKEYPIRYSYTASLPPKEHTFTFGSPSVMAMAPFSGKDLTYSEEEINQSDLYFKTARYAGDTGTEPQFESEANRHDILHLATHGTINGELPELSYLSFAANSSSTSDGRLHVYELENMQLHADLAILSACETGSGNFVLGEGVMSLARGFAYAGVPSILMSLWKVDDQSGAELMKYFYKGLSQESDKATALQQAKIQYLENADQLHAHPYFWSQFVLVGESTPIQSVSTLPLWFTAIALILLVGLGLVRWRKSQHHSN